MGWSIGFDDNWNRDIGYGVPAICDHPGCNVQIDRGLSYVCAEQEPRGGEHGCGLYFCDDHHRGSKPDPAEFDPEWTEEFEYDGPYINGLCAQCASGKPPFLAKPDIAAWINHKLTDESWAEWREQHAAAVSKMRADIAAHAAREGATE